MFLKDLERFGPDTVANSRLTLRESQRYCSRLARQHYENFWVLSCFVPRHLRQHIANIYAYCRWADDLADELGDPQRSLVLLDWWEMLLRQCYLGEAEHPVFVALSETIRTFEIPIEPFADLLTAFRRDQKITRYKDRESLIDYCRYSANPVGRLVLHLDRCATPDRIRLSDCICTGLQLANFWQDVADDWQRGRIYLPLDDCQRHYYDEDMFARREANAAFRQLLASEVAWAESFLREGMPLVDRVSRQLRAVVALFVRGGLAILDAIRRQNYDVWNRRPTVSRWKKIQLLFSCWFNRE